MHGYLPLVERKIRLWIEREERNRRLQAPPGPVNPLRDRPIERHGRALGSHRRKHPR
jgi:hypothetical protein